jgi:hypothetical protein
VPLEAGPRLVGVSRRAEQELERPFVYLLRKRVLQIGFLRIEEIDPLGHSAEATARPG